MLILKQNEPKVVREIFSRGTRLAYAGGCHDGERIQGEKVECMYAELVVKVFKQLIELWILTSAITWCAGCRAGPRSLGLLHKYCTIRVPTTFVFF